MHADRAPWVGLRASMKRVRSLCNARTRWSQSWSRNAVQRSLSKVLSCKPLAVQRRLEEYHTHLMLCQGR